METRIDRIRALAVKSVNAAGDRAAEHTPPSHDLREGTRVFISAAVDFLCSLIDDARMNTVPIPETMLEELVANAIASKVVDMLRIAARQKI
ncbi:hypothetical protein LCGC14_1582360 [marine sediment metagenome]|uniref:Uncharacterized protein n=1 Tax=marine sediment metagenome TaxID=412755 RepID=A0A0F9IGP7_9ZZZZ